eukprot:1075616-Rhodomonas_salina.1
MCGMALCWSLRSAGLDRIPKYLLPLLILTFAVPPLPLAPRSGAHGRLLSPLVAVFLLSPDPLHAPARATDKAKPNAGAPPTLFQPPLPKRTQASTQTRTDPTSRIPPLSSPFLPR